MKKFILAAAACLVLATGAAAAVNPFADVPAAHWAYDAVATLASRGVISGYADGTYSGSRPATRYEMASAVARALAVIDMERASKQDVEMLKRLVVEFKDELDALGVKVDALDSRIAVLERDMGGWSIAGQFRFDAKFANEGSGVHNEAYNLTGKNQFDLDRYRLYLRKRINDTTSFTMRLGAKKWGKEGNGRGGVEFEQYYVTTQLGRHVELSAGVRTLDWEGDLGLYVDDSAYYGNVTLAHFRLWRDWGKASLQLVIGRLNDTTGFPVGWGYDDLENTLDPHGTDPEKFEQFLLAALFNYQFSEKFRAGLMFYGQHSDHDEKTYPNGVELDACLNTYGAYAAYAFTPSIELKGVYYRQELSEYQCDIKQLLNDHQAHYKRYANFWRVMLDVKQEALKFTSLWLEYGQLDNNFTRLGTPAATGDFGADILRSQPFNHGTTRFWGARADQKWNTKWRTFVKYWHFDWDTAGYDDASLWALGVGYRLNPAVEFELGYEKVDYGNSWHGARGRDTDESVIRFRTFVTF